MTCCLHSTKLFRAKYFNLFCVTNPLALRLSVDLLTVPRVGTKPGGEFNLNALHIWNKLPKRLRSASKLHGEISAWSKSKVKCICIAQYHTQWLFKVF